MSKTKPLTALPESLYQFFWDVDPQKIDTYKNGSYVINRLLDKGDEQAVRWVLKNYSKEDIADTFKIKRDFSPKTATFWSLYLGIPKEKMKCFQKPFYQLRRQLWPY